MKNLLRTIVAVITFSLIVTLLGGWVAVGGAVAEFFGFCVFIGILVICGFVFNKVLTWLGW